MPDPIPTQEQLDEAREGYVEGYEKRRLNLACRLILSVCGPWIIYTVLGALVAQQMLDRAASFGAGIAEGRMTSPAFAVESLLWVRPLTALLSTILLLFLWRKPINPAPIVSPTAAKQGPGRSERLKGSGGEGLTGFQGFVKSFFV